MSTGDNERNLFPNLFSGTVLKGKQVKNRLAFPPMVCFGYTDDQGFVSSKHVEHYRMRAESGAAVVITEATAIKKEGRAAPTQLGIWSDDHIAGLSEISQIVKSYGAISLLQLHHAGLQSPAEVTPVAAGPSADPEKPIV